MQRIFQSWILFQAAIYFTVAERFIQEQWATSLLPKYWYLSTLGSALAIIVARPWIVRDLPHHFIVWLWVYLCHTIVLFLMSSQSAVVMEDLIHRFSFIALLAAFVVMVQVEGTVRTVRLALFLTMVFAVVMNVMDFIEPTWTVTPGRAAGTYREPNLAGEVLALGMVLSIKVVPRNLRLLYCFFLGFGILVTFSRGGWLLWALGVIGLVLTGSIGYQRKVLPTVAIGFVSIIIMYSLVSGKFGDFFTATGLDTYLTGDTTRRLGIEQKEFVAIDDREASYVAAWLMFQEHPWFGHGLGYGWEWSSHLPRDLGYSSFDRPHNMYLLALLEGGVIAVAIFVGLLVILWYTSDPNGRVFVVLYAVGSMGIHTNLEFPGLLLMIALALAARGPTASLTAHRSDFVTTNLFQRYSPSRD